MAHEAAAVCHSLQKALTWYNTNSYMQMQKAVRSLPVAKRMRLLLAAALLEEGESLVQKTTTAVSSSKASAKHMCLMT
jgi:hypothetical protein